MKQKLAVCSTCFVSMSVAGVQELGPSLAISRDVSRGLDQKWSSQDSNWCPCGILVLHMVTQPAYQCYHGTVFENNKEPHRCEDLSLQRGPIKIGRLRVSFNPNFVLIEMLPDYWSLCMLNLTMLSREIEWFWVHSDLSHHYFIIPLQEALHNEASELCFSECHFCSQIKGGLWSTYIFSCYVPSRFLGLETSSGLSCGGQGVG